MTIGELKKLLNDIGDDEEDIKIVVCDEAEDGDVHRIRDVGFQGGVGHVIYSEEQ